MEKLLIYLLWIFNIMKTTLTRLLATVLFAGISAVVQAGAIPLEEVKVGATVTREGIGLGWGDYLPVPEGEWEVIMREDGTYKGYGPYEKSLYVNVQLLNKNPKSPLQLVRISHSYPSKIRMSSTTKCEGFLFSDRLETLEGQNFQLCIGIYNSLLVNKVFDSKGKDDKILKVDKKDDNFLEQKFGISNPKMLIGSLRSGKKGNYGLRYQFAFSFNNPTLNSENPDFKSVQDWLYLNIKKAEKYYDGEKITFTEFNLK